MAEEASEQDLLKVSRVRQLGERWEAAYQHIETVLGELKTWLEGEPIDNVELLGVKSAQLNEVKAQINSSVSLVDAMFTADPDQTTLTMEAQGTRKTQAEVKVHACEELMAKMKSAINAKNAAVSQVTQPNDSWTTLGLFQPEFKRCLGQMLLKSATNSHLVNLDSAHND